MARNQLQFLMMEFTQQRVNVLRKEYHLDDEVVPVRNITNGGPYLPVIHGGECVVTDGPPGFFLQNIPIVEAHLVEDVNLQENSEQLSRDQREQMANMARQLIDIVGRFSEQQNHAAAGNNSAPVLNDLTLEERTLYDQIRMLNAVSIHSIARLLGGNITRRRLQIALDFIIANTSGTLSIGLALDLHATLLALRCLTGDDVAWVSGWIVDYIIQSLPNWRRLFPY